MGVRDDHPAAGEDRELATALSGLVPHRARRVAVAVVDAGQIPTRSRFACLGADSGTPFEIGSISKALTGLLLADAVERAELTLEATVGEVLGPAAPPRLAAVTVGQLCTHTSGLARGPLSPVFLLRAVVLLGLAGLNPYGGLSASWVLRAAGRRPLRHPGSWAYSNLGAAVLGQLIATAASQPFPALLRDRILTPIGMPASRVATTDTAAAPGRSALGLPRRPWVLDGFAPAGGVVATVTDMSRLAAALLTGTTAGGTRTPGLAALQPIPGVQAGAVGRRSGMFWILDATPGGDPGGALVGGQARIWHNGGTGGYSAFLALYPEVRQALIVLRGSARGADTEQIAAGLARTFLR